MRSLSIPFPIILYSNPILVSSGNTVRPAQFDKKPNKWVYPGTGNEGRTPLAAIGTRNDAVNPWIFISNASTVFILFHQL
jgi:hypothetical protein